MGVECPNGHGHQAIVKVETADGQPVTSTNPVIRRHLACNCTIGGPGYDEYVRKVNEAKKAHYERTEASRAQMTDELAKLAAGMHASKGA